MKKQDVLKLAMIGLALGGAISSCTSNSGNGQSGMSNSEKSTCKGVNGCTGKSDCIGSTGCKGVNGCTGKSDCIGPVNMNGSKNNSNMQSGASSDLKAKREATADSMTKK